jgi:hypothetical protein
MSSKLLVLSGFLLSCGHPTAPMVGDAQAQHAAAVIADGVLARVQAQMTDISPQTPGPNPVADDAHITPDIAWDPEQFNPKREICVSSVVNQMLVGYADEGLVKGLLGDGLEPVVADFKLGRRGVPVVVSAGEDIGLVGCTCPPKFEEFAVSVLVKDPGTSGEDGVGSDTSHIVFLYLATNHAKRQETMVHKFSVPEQFVGLPDDPNGQSHIGTYADGDRVKGLYLQDQNGKVVFSAKRRVGHIPQPELSVALSDGIFYSQGGLFTYAGDTGYDVFGLDGTLMPAAHFRLQDRDHLVAFDANGTPPLDAMFLPLADEWQADPDSDVGRVLHGILFNAVVWSSEAVTQGMAWNQPPN